MKRKLTDLTQLSKTIVTPDPPADAPQPSSTATDRDREADAVLAYFSRPATGGKTVRKNRADVQTAKADPKPEEALAREVEALRVRLQDSAAARTDAEERLARSEEERRRLTEALAAAHTDLERLKGECGRLQGEVRNASRAADVASGNERAASPAARSAETPCNGVLSPPPRFAEAFPGEVREMLLSALSEARDAAHQSARDRRGAVLDAVLAANRPTGELERRRAELKQILKNAGYTTDPQSLEGLGFKLVSGRTHWKLEYAGIRVPLAKTPSDYRANLNTAIDMANRCF